jgi:hypothetical protein
VWMRTLMEARTTAELVLLDPCSGRGTSSILERMVTITRRYEIQLKSAQKYAQLAGDA